MSLIDILNQVMGAGKASDDQFDQVARQAPSEDLAAGLAHAFRSDQTPDIGAMVAQMFGQSNPNQQAGLLNQIIRAIGPAAAASMAGGVLGKILQGGQREVTPEQASQISPTQVQEVVAEANQAQPDLADQLASFYANNQTLVKVLGGVALAVMLGKMAERNQRG